MINKPEEVDSQEEKEKYRGMKIRLHTRDSYSKILESFWGTPCGYWTQCFHIENPDESRGYIMRSQVVEFEES